MFSCTGDIEFDFYIFAGLIWEKIKYIYLVLDVAS